MVDAVRAAAPNWLLASTTYLLGRAALMIGSVDPWVESTLEVASGTWVLLGTGAATLGPVDAVLAALARRRGGDEAADRLQAAALRLCTQLRAPAWAADTHALQYSSAHDRARHV